MSLKLRLGNIVTPGRVCSPHNEIYDCRIRPNGIGCLRRRSTRRRLGHWLAGCLIGQEPAFRAGSASERNDLPVRNARFPIRASRTLRRLAYSGYAAGKRERKERERDEVPPGAVSVRRRTAPPGDRTGNEAGERAERPRVRLGLAEPGSEEGSCDRFPGSTDRPFPTETSDEPGISANPITHFVTPAILGGVFGPYFPMAGNPLAWSRLENTCTWHIRYINAYDRSAKYFSIPKPG